MSTSRPSVAVLVSGIVAILGSAFAILGTGFTIQALYLIPRPPTVPAMPAYVQTIASASMLIFLGIAVFGVFTGIGVIRLKNWARIAIPIFSGLAVLFGGMALLFLAAMPFPVNPTGPPVNPVVVKGMLLTVHAIPVVIGIWWLILFNLKSAKAQFAGTASEASTGIPSVPACPLPVQIIAVFFLFSVLWMLVVPFMQMPFPALFSGTRFMEQAERFCWCSLRH